MAKSYIMPNRVVFERLAPDRLKVMIGGGWNILFGSLFLLPMLPFMLTVMHFMDIPGDSSSFRIVPVLGLFGLPFFLVGVWMICCRRWLTFDLSRGALVIESGLLIPMLRRERSLQEFTSATIQYQIQSVSGGDGPSSFADIYPVILTTRAGGNALTLNDRATYQQAYAQASTIAEFICLPVRDQSTDHPLEIAPADLARPLQARLRADAVQQQLAAPAALRSQIEESQNGLLISIPGKTNNSLMTSLVPHVAIAATIIFLIILRTYFQSAHMPAFDQYLIMGLAALFGGISALNMLIKDGIARRTKTVVSIDSQGIMIEERRGKRIRNMVMIPIADIIDIDYSLVEDRRRPKSNGNVLRKVIGSKGITIKAKSGFFTFGAGLPDDEVEYLAMVAEKALSSIPV